jgi:hypothetical protein
MTRPGSPFPPRLRSEGGTPLEQRLLNAATRQEPSPELSARMAAAIGVVAPAPAPAPSPEPSAGMAGTGTVAPKAAVGTSTLWPWVSGFVIVAVTGAIVALRPSGETLPSTPRAPSVVEARPAAPAPRATTDEAKESESVVAAAKAGRVAPNEGAVRPRPEGATASSSAISEQIALVDAASAAVSAGAGERALAVLREYQSKYPAGSFRPEVSALRIEALMLVGRREEARSLAKRFVSQYKGPLADRVARVAGLPR